MREARVEVKGVREGVTCGRRRKGECSVAGVSAAGYGGWGREYDDEYVLYFFARKERARGSGASDWLGAGAEGDTGDVSCADE